ncbi:MAG: hypothetical protein ABDH19_02225 [Thermodesulfovibrio sp.]
MDAPLKLIDKIAYREKVDDLALKDVKALKLSPHNLQANPLKALFYVKANREGCHLNENIVKTQNLRAMIDATGVCLFATMDKTYEKPIISMLSTIQELIMIRLHFLRKKKVSLR